VSIYFPQGILQLRVLLEDFSTKSARLQTPYVWTVIAKNLKVNLNSYAEADTFTASIDFKNLPFDPRIIRSCGVNIHMENKRRLFQEKSKDKSTDEIQATDKNIIFSGFADTDKIELGSDSRVVTLEGRDFTSLLIDREYLGEPISLADPVDVVLTKLLNELPQTKVDPSQPNQGLELDTSSLKPEDLPVLANVAPSKDSLSGHSNPRTKRSYWDKIQEIVNNSGLIAYVAINKLVLTKPRNLYDRKQSKVFVYGRNVSNLEFERKLGRQKGFNIRCVCLSDKTVIEAKIPEQATEEWSKETGILREAVTLPVVKAPAGDNLQQGETNTDKPTSTATSPSGKPVQEDKKAEVAPYITFKISNVGDQAHLIKIGEKIYEELGRQQIEGRLTTKEMKIHSPQTPGEKFFDATKFRIGVPIELRLDVGDLEGLQEKTTGKNISARRDNIRDFLVRRGYGRNNPIIAEAMADALTKFDTPFFTKAVEFSLDHEQGFSMEIEFINFIEIPKHLVEGNLNG